MLYRQNGLELAVDLRSGQKTGSYLDQRLNHVTVAQYHAGRRVLDVCCYTGGFGLVAAKAGAAVGRGASIRAGPPSSEGRSAAARNGIESMEFREGDCFDDLKQLGEQGEQFDAVVLDPPRFAGSRHQIDRPCGPMAGSIRLQSTYFRRVVCWPRAAVPAACRGLIS